MTPASPISRAPDVLELPAVAAAPRHQRGARLRDAGKGLAGVAVAIGIWELLRLVGVLPQDSAPSFFEVLPTLVRETASGSLASALVDSARVWAGGLALTLAIAIPLGALVGLSRWADALTAFVFDFLRPVPAVTFVPVAVVFFGLGARMQMFLIVIAAVWPVIYNTRYGVRGVDPLFLDTARTMGLGRTARLRRVIAPAALPTVFTGIRTAAAIAVVVTVVSELVASSTGLGGFINRAQDNNLPAQALAGVLMAGLLGYAVYLLVDFVEGRATRWHRLSTVRGR